MTVAITGIGIACTSNNTSLKIRMLNSQLALSVHCIISYKVTNATSFRNHVVIADRFLEFTYFVEYFFKATLSAGPGLGPISAGLYEG